MLVHEGEVASLDAVCGSSWFIMNIMYCIYVKTGSSTSSCSFTFLPNHPSHTPLTILLVLTAQLCLIDPFYSKHVPVFGFE